MLLERAELQIRKGSEADFDKAMRERGLPMLEGTAGVRWVSMGRGVENPDKFMLLVEWDSMEAHSVFPDSEIYPEFRELIGAYSSGGSMEHFEMQDMPIES